MCACGEQAVEARRREPVRELHGRQVAAPHERVGRADRADEVAVEVLRVPARDRERRVLEHRLRIDEPGVEREPVEKRLQRRAGRAPAAHAVDGALDRRRRRDRPSRRRPRPPSSRGRRAARRRSAGRNAARRRRSARPAARPAPGAAGSIVVSIRLASGAAATTRSARCGARDTAASSRERNATSAKSKSTSSCSRRHAVSSRTRAAAMAVRPDAVDGLRACGLFGTTASDSASAGVSAPTRLPEPAPSSRRRRPRRCAPYGARLRYASRIASFENAQLEPERARDLLELPCHVRVSRSKRSRASCIVMVDPPTRRSRRT